MPEGKASGAPADGSGDAVSETQTVMCVNSGSSSLKFHLYEMGSSETIVARGAVEGIGQGAGKLWFVDGGGVPFAECELDDAQYEDAIEQALVALSTKDLASIEAIGHRVVHGGPNHLAPELLTSELIDDLRKHLGAAPPPQQPARDRRSPR
jgi:acetate kinase